VEKPVTEWLEKMGWTYRSPDDLKIHKRRTSNPIIDAVLLQRIQSINHLDAELAQRILDTLLQALKKDSPILGNEQFLEKLAKGVTLSINNEDRDFQFIDFDAIWNNDFCVTRQYAVQGQAILRTDIVLLVNGIPLVPIEAKQRARKNTNWLEGVKQFSTYAQRAESYFISHLFGVSCNGRLSKYGIPGASSSYFNEWKDTVLDTAHDNPLLNAANDLCRVYQDDKTGLWHFDVERLPNGDVLERMKLGIVGLLQPARVLDILQNFIVFERCDGKVIKKVARYQQLRAANKIVERVVNSDLKQGIIWHTQGSGKSLTMLYTAHKLRQAEQLNDPTVYIVVDRKDLREQLGGTFDDCEFSNARSVLNINDLKHIIDSAPAGVFITTIQKFRELGDRQDLRDNVVILIDEAHRSQYGEFQIELQHVLPNAKRFAFTGTPIPKTSQEFGINDGKAITEHYLDRYSIKDAIEDGATKPIRYTFGPQKWFLDKEKLKQGYDEITADLDDDEKRAVERKVQAWKVFLKHPERVAVLAEDIAKDFREVVEPQGYKAQVVVCDKEACILYYEALLKYFDASEMRIVFSDSSYFDMSGDEDDPETQRKKVLYQKLLDHQLIDSARRKVVKDFKKRLSAEEVAKGNNLKILIVCNMLLTGFDAPIEQSMYLDSPIRDHNLLQAVARTNRPYDDPVSKLAKEFGRIVDYIGIFENYQAALNYDPEDIGEFEDVESLIEQFPAVLDKAMQAFEHIALEDSYECSMALVKVLNELDHGVFETQYKEVIQLFESVSPHPKLRPYLPRYLWLNEIYEIYLEEFKRTDFEAEVYAAKTRRLIEESTKLLDFRGHLPEINIDERYLDNLHAGKLSPDDKAEKIIRDIETVIRRHEASSAVYVEFQERLDELIKTKQGGAKRIEDILSELEKLFTEVEQVGSLPERMGFEDRGTFDIYMEVKNALGGSFNEDLAKQFSLEIVAKVVMPCIYVGWQEIDKEIDRLKHQVDVFAAGNDYLELAIDENPELIQRIVDRIVQHYELD
ncbi:MAG: type I restriction endonuclease subunit R, partial [Methylobacter sp.]